MELLTDGSEKNPILGFCLTIVSKHAHSWPPTEEVLAQEFVDWLGFNSLMTRDAMKELCQSKGVNLSFVSLPHEIRGVNCSFQGKREIVVTERGTAPFSDSHTLLHEFREMLEHVFTELGYPTISPDDSPEARAEHFAVACRLKAAERELPAFIEMATNVEKTWARYLAYAFLGILAVAYVLDCIFLPQMEEIAAEAERQRYVRT